MESTTKVLQIGRNEGVQPKETVVISMKGRVFKRAWTSANADGVEVSIAAKKNPFSSAKYSVRVDQTCALTLRLKVDSERYSRDGPRGRYDGCAMLETEDLLARIESGERIVDEAHGTLLQILDAVRKNCGERALRLLREVSEFIGDKNSFRLVDNV